jgi:homoserine dehydrogenase
LVRTIRLGLVGFGTVGRAFARLVADERGRIRAERGVDLRITGITTGRFGGIIDASGIDVAAVLDRARRGQPHGPAPEATHFAAGCPADVIVETMPLEPFHGAHATAVVRAALTAGRCVVSANKGPVAHAYGELRRLAAECG